MAGPWSTRSGAVIADDGTDVGMLVITPYNAKDDRSMMGYVAMMCPPVALVDWSSDLRRFSRRRDAIQHGFNTSESDDFNIGTLHKGRLIALGWMDDDFGVVQGEDNGGYDIDEISRALCLGGAL
jgi:hypothetical protein